MDNDKIKKNNKSFFKRLLSLLLSLLMIVTVIPIGNYIEAQAAVGGVEERINQIKEWFPNVTFEKDKNGNIKRDSNNRKIIKSASYFTVNGKPCVSSGVHTDCNNCNLQNIVAKNSKIKDECKNWKGVPEGYTCWAFAQFAWRYIFTPEKEKNKTGKYNVYKSCGGTNSTYKELGKHDKESLNRFFEECKIGDYISLKSAEITAKDGSKYRYTHYGIFMGYTKNEKLVLLDCNHGGAYAYKKGANVVVHNYSISYNTLLNTYTQTISRHRAKNYDEINKVVYSVKTSNGTNATNTSANVNSSISPKANVTKVRYWISKSQNDLKNDSVIAKHADTSTIDCRYAKDDGKSQSLSSHSFLINNFLSKPLEANTTYYYRAGYYVNSKWYYSSNISSFKTTNNSPSAFSLKTTAIDSGLNSTVSISWNKSNYANSYTVYVADSENNVIYTSPATTGTIYAIPADYFNAVGNYKITVTAHNNATNNASVEASNFCAVTVHPNVNVTFVDSITNEIIETKSIPYGENADNIVAPSRYGYSFKKWDASLTNIKEDIAVHTVYEPNEYTVKFVDSVSNKILKTEKVKYLQSATAPNTEAPTGYKLVGWDKDYSSITEDTTIYTNYEWYNSDYPIHTKVDSFERDSTKQGYVVNLSLLNGTDEIVKGRAIVVLKSKSGAFLSKTDSAAFTIAEDSTSKLKLTILSDSLAYQAEIYVVNSYDDVGTLASPITHIIDNSSAWSGWIEYEGEIPAKVGVNGVSQIEEKTETHYRKKTKSTTTSYATSMSGWTQNGYSLVDKTTGTINYVSSWPSGFDKSNSLYTKYNKTPKSAVDNATTKTTVSTSTKGYIYWHWCYGKSYSTPQNHYINWSKTTKFCKFHAFERSSALSWMGKDYDCFKLSDKNKCSDTYWWLGAKSGTNQQIVVKTQNYTTYKKLYSYYKWSDWSEWSEFLSIANSDTQVESKTVKYYRYKSETPIEDKQVKDSQIVDINGLVDSSFAGKEATVYIYKYTEAADYTNEYIGNTIVGSNGEITINDAKLREEPSVETGDYTIIASIAGNTNATKIGTIEAPKPTYTVTFYDFDEKTIISQQTVKDGDTVTSPSADMLHPNKGYRFTNWNQSTVNVKGDLNVYPECEKQKCVIAFVDWVSQEVTLQEFEYGDEIITPELSQSKEGTIVSWNMSNVTKETEKDENGIVTDKFIATQNDVITTDIDTTSCKIDFLSPTQIETSDIYTDDIVVDSEEIEDIELIESVSVEYGDDVEIPDITYINEEYEFYGWRNAQTGEWLCSDEITNSATYYPVYTFKETTETPTADVATGEYIENQAVTLSSETENAVIYYTTDGTNPKTSSTAKEYTEPIALTNSCNLMFYAASLNRNDSAVVSMLYAINTASSGAAYHIVTVYNSVQNEGYVYQALIREARQFDDSEFDKDIVGYTYNGLYFDEEYTKPFYADEEYIYESTDIYAKYTPNQYKVTFVDYDDSVISTATQTYNEEEISRPTPSREGFVFIGWENDVDLSTITEDITLKAKYCPIDEYATVSLNKANSNIIEGQVYTKLVATVTPEKLSDTPLTWVSSNPDILTVDADGVVTAISKGTATITVIVDSTGESASCEFIVSGDYTKSVVLGRNSYLNYDSEGYIRELKPNSNSVSSVIYQFNNDAENLAFFDINSNSLTDDALVGTGSVVRLMDNNEILDSSTFIMTGDINGDGYIGNADVSMLMQWLVEKKDLSYEQQLAGDVNGDGNVDNKDATVIARYLVGKESI